MTISAWCYIGVTKRFLPEKKTAQETQNLIAEFDSLLNKADSAFGQKRIAHQLRNLAFGALTCLGRQTVSGILTASGQQFVDWSAAYRIFSQNRIIWINCLKFHKMK
jgi:hypothetical protein